MEKTRFWGHLLWSYSNHLKSKCNIKHSFEKIPWYYHPYTTETLLFNSVYIPQMSYVETKHRMSCLDWHLTLLM